jgi:hypothetical protein
MAADQQTANDLLGDDKAVRRWTDYGDLVRYGWLEEEGRSPDASMAQDSLGTAGVFQELSIDVGQNEKVRVDHSETVVIDGNEYKVNIKPSWLLLTAYLLVSSRKPRAFTKAFLMSTLG